jgi:hypothetical protein
VEEKIPVSFGLNRCFLGILKDESVLVYGSFETKETWRGDGGIGSEKNHICVIWIESLFLRNFER